jgi:hypothetical protein
MADFRLKLGELEKLRTNYPDKIPVFVSKVPNSNKSTPDIRKHKFLVPSHFTMGGFMSIIRKWIQLPPEMGLFFYVGNINPCPSSLLIEIYEKHKGPDEVLRVQYACENTFG